MLSLIIDRVGNVNVFNLFENSIPAEESHLQSTIDRDLISEFITEADRLVRVSHSLLLHPNAKLSTDILHDLRVLGETFYYQFFPEQITKKLAGAPTQSLHLNLDPSLASIPWDLLHDGQSFLSDRFWIGKTIQGGIHLSPSYQINRVKMLIIADPTEDLPNAQKEGETLLSVLNQKIHSKRLELEFIGGSQVTKLKILSLIKDKHIIHYSGHLFFDKDPLENGWLLSDGKVLKAREIKSTGIKTELVFSNSCLSAKAPENNMNPSLLNQFAGAFLASGIKTFIGTNWEVPDNQDTIDFTIRFYSFLFGDKSIGEALFQAKEYARRHSSANDFSWANYSLFGNPEYSLPLKTKEDITEKKALNLMNLQNLYPTPISKCYMDAFQIQKSERSSFEQLKALSSTFLGFTSIVGGLVFGDYKHNALSKPIPDEESRAVGLIEFWEWIFISFLDFKRLDLGHFSESLPSVMEKHKDIIWKIIGWIESWELEEPRSAEIGSYGILFRVFLDNLLFDFQEIEKIKILYLAPTEQILFRGSKTQKSILPPLNGIEIYRNRMVAIHEKKNIMIPFIGIPIESNGDWVIKSPGLKSI